MAQTPEGLVKAQVKKILTEYKCYSFMPVQNGMGAPALDFHCICCGVGFCIETKAPGKKATARQANTILHIESAGGKTFIIDGERGYKQLREWLALVHAANGGDDDEHAV